MGTLDADTLEHGFDVFGKIMIADVPALAALIERAVAHSVDATDEEKAEYRANIARNLAWWRVHAAQAVHLKFGDAGTLAGVVLVKEHWNAVRIPAVT